VAGKAETRGNLITSIQLNFDELEQHNLKLQAKYDRIRENETEFEGYRLDDADVILVSYGISSRIARSAVDAARKEGIKAGLFRPISPLAFPGQRAALLCRKRGKAHLRGDERRPDERGHPPGQRLPHCGAGLPLWRTFD